MDDGPGKPNLGERLFWALALGAPGALFTLDGLGITHFGVTDRPLWVTAAAGVAFLTAGLMALAGGGSQTRGRYFGAFIVVAAIGAIFAQHAFDFSRFLCMTDGDARPSDCAPEGEARLTAGLAALFCGVIALAALYQVLRRR